ncbi:hypothetical protein BDA99DRAFT_554561 [Phascolomyces articulosus]|uniref:Uncharacterized protein n=1 Tax=Phascolomyces articulosus TaxID=60185 RepID=A0AAD5PN06_9FUNG|nr:hypothetical protein BDA99DRAFT_554561 [Phascolomyces articulosus]
MAAEHTPIIKATKSFLLEAKNRGERSVNSQSVIDHLENDTVSSSTTTDIAPQNEHIRSKSGGFIKNVSSTTMGQAEEDNAEPISVEEKVMTFALQCDYYHPSQSLILDLGDKNWCSVFSEEELDELHGAGGDLPCGVPKELEQCFKSLTKSRQSLNEVISWQKGKTKKSSEANVSAVNQNRQLSSIMPISNRKMGRRGDTIFNSGHIELGCTEIGAAKDQTKEIRDGLLKMPIVLRDMLLLATFSPNLLHQAHVIGYSISGGCVSLLDVSIPKSFITIIRRTDPLEYPNKNNNLMPRLCPLLNLACIGKETMEQTLYLIVILNTIILLCVLH